MLMLQGSSFRVGGSCFASSDSMSLLFSCGHWDRTFQALDVDSGKALQSISYHHGTVTCMAYGDIPVDESDGAPNYNATTIHVGSTTVYGVLVTGSEDCTVAVWGLLRKKNRKNKKQGKKNSKNRKENSSHSPSSSPMSSMSSISSLSSSMSSASSISALSSSRSGADMIGGDDSGGDWRPVIPYPLLVLHGHDAPVTSVTVSCDLGIVISASEDGTAIVYSLTDGAYIRTIGKSSIYKSPDLATHTYRNRSPKDGAQEDESKVSSMLRLAVAEDDGPGSVTWVGVTSEGGYILLYFGEDMLIRVYTLNGKMLHEIEINERLHALIFSEDGKYLITGGTGRHVVVRDIYNLLSVVRRINGSMKSSPLMPQGLFPFEASIQSLSLTPKERHLVIGLSNGIVRIIALNAQYLRDRLQERLSSLGF